MNIVVPFGFYGWGNIGDEATLTGFRRLLDLGPPKISAWIGSRNRAHTKRVEPRFRYFTTDQYDWRARWANRRSKAVVFAGGTPIMDGLGTWPLSEVAPLVRAAHERNKPVAFVGIGTESLERPESKDAVRSELGPRVERWTVRSERDLERLCSWGVPRERIRVAADLAWLLPQVQSSVGHQILADCGLASTPPLIAININNEPAMLEQQPELFRMLAAFADRIATQKGCRILFVCSEVRDGPEFDLAAAKRVVEAMRFRDRACLLPNRYWTPTELASILGCCELVVSSRYHVCLLSALQRVPFIALQRSDKVRDLCSDIGWTFGSGLADLSCETLLDLSEAIEAARASLVAGLDSAARRQASRSAENRWAIDNLKRFD